MLSFDQLERYDDKPKGYAESSFHFLNHANRPAAESIRQMIKKWFDKYPTSNQSDLCGRFRSEDDNVHLAAFFELLLHQVLIQMGGKIAVHPNTNDAKNKTPDYLVTDSNGQQYYLEATLTSGKSNDERRKEAIENSIYDAINKMDSPDYFIGLKVRGAPQTQPSGKRISEFLKHKLNQLNYSEIADLCVSADGYNLVPHWKYQHEGWDIEFFPIPKSLNRGKQGVRPIGTIMTGIEEIDSRKSINNAIIKKAGKYGLLNLPFIIAVNLLDNLEMIDILDALFGQETVCFSVQNPQLYWTSRKRNGAWTNDQNRPTYTRVSAVLMMGYASPWNVENAPAYLCHNPWAVHPYCGILTAFPQVVVNEHGEIKSLQGKPLKDILAPQA